jgi:8-oxo-dGTP pyrophosphatase MutT (NUDIX family)
MQLGFSDFLNKLSLRLSLPLPGAAAHEPLRAVPADSAKLMFNHKLPPKPGSVLILLYEEAGVIKFPLTKRATYKGAHSGQVSLPGGKKELGETDFETALRECEEEIGVRRSEINVLGRLTDFFVMPSNFLVVPVVGYTSVKPSFKADPVEVDALLDANLLLLLADDSVKEKEIVVANEFRLKAPHFEIDGEIVWGATAMMLNEFRVVAREALQLTY